MEVKDIFSLLVKEIHSTVFATVDKNGFPHTCVIDLMLCDDSSIYFLTSRGKEFYTRLLNQEYVSLSGMKGNDTLSTVVAVSYTHLCIGRVGNTYLNLRIGLHVFINVFLAVRTKPQSAFLFKTELWAGSYTYPSSYLYPLSRHAGLSYVAVRLSFSLSVSRRYHAVSYTHLDVYKRQVR